MVVLLDESAAVDLLIRSDAGAAVRRFLSGVESLAVVTVAHLDAEVLSGLARLSRADVLTAEGHGAPTADRRPPRGRADPRAADLA